MDIESEGRKKFDQKRLIDSDRCHIIGCLECCNDQMQTSRYFGVSQSTISRILAKFRVNGDVSDYQRSGRPSILEEEQKETVQVLLESNKYISNLQISKELEVSRPTALKFMHDIDLNFSKPKTMPQLNSSHIEKRYDYTKLIEEKQIENIVFTDESYFQLYRNTHGFWHFSDAQNYVSMPQNKVCFMVYVAISNEGKSKIHIFDQEFKINSEEYQKILKKILIPYTNKVFQPLKNENKQREWFLIQDNTPCHRSSSTTKFLVENNIQIIKHPPNNPDLNPIEQIWAILKKRVEKNCTKNGEELKQSIKNEWKLIEQETIQACIQHYCKRLDEVYVLEGQFY